MTHDKPRALSLPLLLKAREAGVMRTEARNLVIA